MERLSNEQIKLDLEAIMNFPHIRSYFYITNVSLIQYYVILFRCDDFRQKITAN